ncbi:MAG: hypothetical protein ABI604_16295 [Nitrospirota bacterium]
MRDTREQTLPIIVVRLLAIALVVTEWPQLPAQTAMLPMQNDYRAWPMVESELASCGRRQRLRFYVCPNAAILSDDEPFPVGTAFLVETAQIEPIGQLLVSRFVMEKYAGVTTGISDRVPYGAWASATYGPASEQLPMDEMSYGI